MLLISLLLLAGAADAQTWGYDSIAPCSDTDLLYSMHFGDQNTGYASTWGGVVIKTSDRGDNWAEIASLSMSVFCLHFTNADTGWASSHSGSLRRTNDGGVNWITQSTGTNDDLTALFFVNEDTGFAVGGYSTGPGVVFKTTNGGNTWVSQNPVTTEDLRDVYFTSPLVGYAVGFNGAAIKTVDGGANWSVLNAGTIDNLYAVFFTSADTGYVGGYGGTLLKTTDGGTNWLPVNLNISFAVNDIHFVNYDFGYVVGGTSGVYRTTDGGLNWSQEILPVVDNGNELNGVYFPVADTGFIVGPNAYYALGCTGCNIIYKFDSTMVGMGEVIHKDKILVYPSPTEGKFAVQGATGEIRVYDLFGRKVLTTTLPQIDMRGYAKGVYFVRVGEVVRKLVLH